MKCGGEMKLDLSEEEALALCDLLDTAVQADNYPLSPRAQTLRDTGAKLFPMVRALEESRRVKAEAVAAPEAELDRRELERELRAVPIQGELDREMLERELRQSGPDGAAAAWETVDAKLRVERAGLGRRRDELPEDPLNALLWASELYEAAARWWAWEVVRSRAQGTMNRTWATLQAAEGDLRERLACSRNGRGNPALGGLKPGYRTVALDLVLGEVRELVSVHHDAVAALYARASHAGIA